MESDKGDAWKRRRSIRKRELRRKDHKREQKKLRRFKCWTPLSLKDLRHLITFIMKGTRRRFKRKWIPGYVRSTYIWNAIFFLLRRLQRFLSFFPFFRYNDPKTQWRTYHCLSCKLDYQTESWCAIILIRMTMNAGGCCKCRLIRDEF